LNTGRHFLLKFNIFKSIIGDEPTFIFQNHVPDYLKNLDESKILSQKLNQNFQQSLKNAKSIANSNQAHFIHIFQPFLNTHSSLTKYEKLLSQNLNIYPESLKLILDQSYAVFSNIEKNDYGNILSSNQLAKTLHTHDNRQEYFLDFCHLNHVGNQLIAREIFNFLDTNNYLIEN
jgi:hypothetical protein